MVAGEDDLLEFAPLTRQNLESISEIVWYPNIQSFRLYVGHQVLDGIGPMGLCRVAIVQEAHMAIENMLFATMNEGQSQAQPLVSEVSTQDFSMGRLTLLGGITRLIECKFGKKLRSCEVGDNCIRFMLV